MKASFTTCAAALIAAGVLALTGCQGSAAHSAAKAPAAAGATRELVENAGPLDQYTMEVQSIYGSTDKTWNLQQQKIADCMTKQGFQYKVVPPNLPDNAKAEAAYNATQQPSFYEKYGYGLYTNPPDNGSGMASPPPDPNDALMATMSSSERAAFKTALYGRGTKDGGPGQKGDTDTKWKDEGCSGQAEHEVTGGPGSDQDPNYESLRKAIRQAEDQESNGSDITKAYNDWSACMTKAGYSGLRQPGDAPTYVSQNAGKNGRNSKQKAEFELKVAKSDYGCQDQVHLNSRINKAMNDAQAQFVSQHKNELDAWVAAARKYADDNGLTGTK